MRKLLFMVLSIISVACKAQKDEIFPTPDGVLVHAKFYYSDAAETKMMILCHQARYSKGEYQETAPKFNKLGYTCLAIDQRSGDKVNGDVNQTTLNAQKLNYRTDYEDAEIDIRAAVHYLYGKYGKKLTLMGSSYSSALVLKVAATEKDKVEAVVSFSPGEYFTDTTIIRESIKKLDIPVWITCSKEEIPETEKLFIGLDKKNITFFKPKKEGKHGSRALWKNNPDNKDYWESLNAFFKQNAVPQKKK